MADMQAVDTVAGKLVADIAFVIEFEIVSWLTEIAAAFCQAFGYSLEEFVPVAESVATVPTFSYHISCFPSDNIFHYNLDK